MKLALSTFQNKIKTEPPPKIKPKQQTKENSSYAHFMKLPTPLTMKLDMPEPDTHFYMHFSLDYS